MCSPPQVAVGFCIPCHPNQTSAIPPARNNMAPIFFTSAFSNKVEQRHHRDRDKSPSLRNRCFEHVAPLRPDHHVFPGNCADEVRWPAAGKCLSGVCDYPPTRCVIGCAPPDDHPRATAFAVALAAAALWVAPVSKPNPHRDQPPPRCRWRRCRPADSRNTSHCSRLSPQLALLRGLIPCLAATSTVLKSGDVIDRQRHVLVGAVGHGANAVAMPSRAAAVRAFFTMFSCR